MKLIHAEKLQEHLKTNLSACYLLCGDEPLLLKESEEDILQAARQKNFSEHFTVTVEGDTQWENVFRIFQELSLFSARQTLVVIFPNKPTFASMNAPLEKLARLVHQDILLILRFHKLTRAQEKSAWYQALAPFSSKINCEKLDQKRLPAWIQTRCHHLHFEIDKPSIDRLCECYEGNILSLSQLLTLLSLAYPNEKLTLPQIEPVLNNFAHFTPYQWSNALLEGNTNRALMILKKLKHDEHEPVILLRILQPNLLLLVTLKRALTKLPLTALFQQHQVWPSRRLYFTSALERLSQKTLTQAVHLLSQIEISLKQDYEHSIWPELEALSVLLCGQPLLHFDELRVNECFWDEC